MKKTKTFLLGMAFMLMPTAVYANIDLDAKSGILYEPTTGKIISEHNAYESLPPASVTKVMTMLLIYEAVEQGKITWDDMVTISDHAANMGGSQIFLEATQKQPVKDLTKSIIIASANDASVAMAEFIAGSEDAFVAKMNEKAKSLGMKNTTFKNACGLDADGHVTSAYDIALMSAELMTRYPDVMEIAKVWMDTITHDTARGKEEFGLTNTNKMIRHYTGATGLKTGSTGDALFCVSATAKRDGLDLIAVIMGSPNSQIRFNEARKLLDYGFANYTVAQGEPADTLKGEINVNKGEKDTIPLVIKEQTNVVMAKGNHVTLENYVETLESISAPVAKGTKAGEVIYTCEGKEVGRSDLVTAEDVEKAGFFHMTQRLLKKWVDS